MPRYAFQLKIKPGKAQEYDEAHREVWPDLLSKLKEVGISHYSIFRRGNDLMLVMEVDNFDRAWALLEQDPVNQQWQEKMADLFAPVPELGPGERFPMWTEVFYLD